MFMLQELQACLSFYCASLYWLHTWCDFTDWKFKQVYHHHFFQQQWFISWLSHFDNSQIFQAFSLLLYLFSWYVINSVQLLSCVQLFATQRTGYSMPGLPVHHQLSELVHIHVHWLSDVIQLSHPLSSPSPPVLNLSQHQHLFKWVSSSHQVARVLELQLQHQSFQWTPRTDVL